MMNIIKSIRVAIFAVIIIAGFSYTALAVQPTESKVIINGVEKQLDSYNISNNNYFKIRDIAYVLNGSNKQFDVSWNSAEKVIEVKRGVPYTVVGGEMAPKGTEDKYAKQTYQRIMYDGEITDLTAYNIDGNTYIRLIDISMFGNFKVQWHMKMNAMLIDTNENYTQSVQISWQGRTIGDIEVGGKVEDSEKILGKPYRILEGTVLEYRLYGDYNKFVYTASRYGVIEHIYSTYNIPSERVGAYVYYSDSHPDRTYAISLGDVTNNHIEKAEVTEALVFELTNVFRAYRGVHALEFDSRLAQLAKAHSQDMADNDFISHISSDGSSVRDRFERAGYISNNPSENACKGPINANNIVDSWVLSHGHRDNMISTVYTKLGVGFVYNPNIKDGEFCTQNFSD